MAGIEDNSLHLTIKVNIPEHYFRAVSKGLPNARFDLDTAINAALLRTGQDAVEHLLTTVYKPDAPKDVYVPPPIPVGSGGGSSDFEECLACQ